MLTVREPNNIQCAFAGQYCTQKPFGGVSSYGDSSGSELEGQVVAQGLAMVVEREMAWLSRSFHDSPLGD